MPQTLKTLALLASGAMLLSGCGVAKTTGKVAAFPVKTVYKTAKFTGKTVYGTGKAVGKGVYGTGKAVGKGVAATGKGIYYIGSVPVKITDKALDTTSKVLTITTKAADATGKVASVTRKIQATELEAELAAIKGATGILSVVVDAIS